MIKAIRKKIGSISVGVKASVVYTISSILSKGLAVITVPIFTRLMTTSEVGVVNLFNSWYSMISAVATLSLTSGGFQIMLKDYAKERDRYVSSVLSLTSIMAILLTIVYWSAPNFWSDITGLSAPLMMLMMIELLLSPAQSFWLARQRYEYKYKKAGAVSILSAILSSFVSVLAVVVATNAGKQNLGTVRLFAHYAVLLSVAFVLWVGIFYKGRTFFHREYWKNSLAISIPLIGNSLASQVLSVSDRTMIGKMISNSAVGIYSTLYTVSSISLLVWGSINASFVPFLFENIEKRERRADIRSLSSKLLAAFAVVSFVMAMMAPEIVRILATEEYYEAIYIMPPIAAGIFFTSVSNMYSNLLIFYKKTGYIMISTIAAALINVALNWFGIKYFGYFAAAYTTLFAYIVMAIIQGFVATRIYKKFKFGDESVYNEKQAVLLSIAAVLACMSCLLLYRGVIIRYAILVIGIVLVIIKRKQIVALLSKKKK